MKKVIKKINKQTCYCCDGKGLVEQTPGLLESCNICDGSGLYEENFYYFIDQKNKIAYSKDTL
jgi:DnaJ-class molecular chaperone